MVEKTHFGRDKWEERSSITYNKQNSMSLNGIFFFFVEGKKK